MATMPHGRAGTAGKQQASEAGAGLAAVLKPETLEDLNRVLGRLLKATLRAEKLTAERDLEIAAIQKRRGQAIDKASADVALLESIIEAAYREHRDEWQQDKKSLQLGYGLVGMRAPSNPSLIPLNAKWSWEAIEDKIRELWKIKYFHKPKPWGGKENRPSRAIGRGSIRPP